MLFRLCQWLYDSQIGTAIRGLPPFSRWPSGAALSLRGEPLLISIDCLDRLQCRFFPCRTVGRYKMHRTLFLFFYVVAATLSATSVPTPESHFGHQIGVDRVLLDWDQVVSYFYDLEKNSPAIHVEEVGKTVEGRPFIAAVISAPENLKNLPKYLDIQRRLADPRVTSPAEAEKLFPQAKNVILITCSVHSTEVASTHTAVQFAYKLLTDKSAKFQAIRQNTIIVLMPSINPDGVDIVTRWYRKTLNTPYEGTNPPELYHHYVGHDDNRDWYTFSQPETRHVISVYNRFLPEILYDVHQQGEKDPAFSSHRGSIQLSPISIPSSAKG
jgi:hypothetical protein